MPASSLILKLSLDGWLPDNAIRTVAAENESSALLTEAVLSDIVLGEAVLGKIALGEVTMSETVLAKVPLVEVVVVDDLLRMVIKGCWVPFAFPFFFKTPFFIAIQRTLLTKQDKNTTINTTNNTTKIRYVNYLLHSTSLEYTTFTFFLYCTPIYLANYNPGKVST